MIVLISEDLMMSSTVSAAVRAEGGSFRFVASVERANVKLEGNDCELLLVDLQTANLDWEGLADLVGKVPKAIGYAQHVNVDILRRARELPFEQVLTRGQMSAMTADIVAGAAPDLPSE
jgi:DNA-binding NtrC family response regulator